jgi:DNA-binding MarR family transcriptional regulator
MNTISAIVRRLRAAYPSFTLRQALAFLYVCENEGLSLKELSIVSRVNSQTLSPAMKALAEGTPNGALLNLRGDPADRRLMLLYPSGPGRLLRDAIDAEILARRSVRLSPARASQRPAGR